MKQSINFWNWFTNNQETLKNSHTQDPLNRIATLNKLDYLLKSQPSDLGYVIVLNKFNSTAELVFTTNGNRECFKTAIQLIDTVPKLKGWVITVQNATEFEVQTSLKDIDECYILGEITLKTDSQICIPIHAQNIPNKQLFIYYKNHHIYCQKQNLNLAIFTIINKCLGNIANTKHINYIQLAQEFESARYYTELFDFEYYLDICKKDQKRRWK